MNFEIGKYKIHLDLRLDKKLPEINWRPFLAGFIVVFLFSLLSSLGLKFPEFHLKKTLDKNSYNWTNNNNISPKLQQKTNNLKLMRETQIISKSLAGEEFENAFSYIVINSDNGKVLMEKVSSEKLPIASLTKVMTAVVSLDLAKQSDLFEISESAAGQIPTKIGVVAGEKMTLEELINAVLLTSANDAAEVIKEGIDSKYGKETFINAMNEKARLLGLKNTHFSNVQGFDNRKNYSTSEDLAILSQFALINYSLIKEVAKKDYEYLPADNNHKVFDLYNWNGLLGVYPGISGLKIGNTSNAGYTTIVSSERQGKKVLAVLLGAPGVIERDLWAAGLLDGGFKKLGISAANVTEEELRVKYATWEYFN